MIRNGHECLVQKATSALSIGNKPSAFIAFFQNTVAFLFREGNLPKDGTARGKLCKSLFCEGSIQSNCSGASFVVMSPKGTKKKLFLAIIWP